MGLCAWSPDAEGHLESPDVVGRMFRSRKTQGSHLWPIFLVKQEGRSIFTRCLKGQKFKPMGRLLNKAVDKKNKILIFNY